jgi:flagellar hook-associated protein 2
MASGLDTDSIVKKLMDVEKMSLNKLMQQQQKEIWRSDAYRQWNKDLFGFQDTLLKMKLSSAYNTFEVSSNQDGVVSGVGTSSAIPGTYTIDKVDSIAKAATFSGNVQIGRTDPVIDTATSFSITVNSDPANPTVSQTASIQVAAGDTIDTIVSNINKATDGAGKSLGIQAYYDSTLNQFILKTKATGAATSITLSADPSDANSKLVLDKLGIVLNTDTNADSIPDQAVQTGQDAAFTFDGKAVTSASNNVTVMGISLTLKNTTTTPSSITVSQDIDAQIENIKDFVNKYNDILDRLNKAYSEPVYRDYQPLLDEERESMSEKQIELWEGKAKSGLLRSDSITSDLINQMRSAMSSIVSNGSNYTMLSSIGIGSKSYSDKGKLYVDEDKLRAAIKADPDAVRNIFSQQGDTVSGTSGLVHRLSDVISAGMKKLTAKAGSTGNSYYDQSVIGKMLSNIQNNIDRQEDRLVNKENQYYKQFAAMEAAMSKYNSQSSWLYQQMGM